MQRGEIVNVTSLSCGGDDFGRALGMRWAATSSSCSNTQLIIRTTAAEYTTDKPFSMLEVMRMARNGTLAMQSPIPDVTKIEIDFNPEDMATPMK